MEIICKSLKRIMVLIFCAIIILSLYMGTRLGGTNLTALVYGVLLCFVLLKFMPRILDCLVNVKEWKLFWGLSAICLAVKTVWIYLVRIAPAVDYATFYSYAESLAENWVAQSRYVALFPHIFGYSSFLSIFIKIFGGGYHLAPIVNVILTLVSGMMLYRIAKTLLNLKSAIFVYLLWICCPSQTIYNSLALSDPLYTTLIIAFLFVLTEINYRNFTKDKPSVLKMIGIGIVAGSILRAINCCRPIATIFLIALFIWIFVLRVKELVNTQFRKSWISFLISVLCVYVITGLMWNWYVTIRLGEKPASVPGYNIMVGFNPESLGKWNQEDSALLFYYSDQPGSTAEWAQQQMLKAAKKRIFSGKIDFSYLLKEKINTFLGADDACVFYHSSVIPNTQDLSIICNSFYYAIMLMGLLGGISLWNRSRYTVAMILPLYVIGLTLAQMLVEVAPRYHYSVIPIILLMGQYALYVEYNQEQKKQKKI